MSQSGENQHSDAPAGCSRCGARTVLRGVVIEGKAMALCATCYRRVERRGLTPKARSGRTPRENNRNV